MFHTFSNHSFSLLFYLQAIRRINAKCRRKKANNCKKQTRLPIDRYIPNERSIEYLEPSKSLSLVPRLLVCWGNIACSWASSVTWSCRCKISAGFVVHVHVYSCMRTMIVWRHRNHCHWLNCCRIRSQSSPVCRCCGNSIHSRVCGRRQSANANAICEPTRYSDRLRSWPNRRYDTCKM